jgi:pimeloyl-ACP methyl ester carboxylesterase
MPKAPVLRASRNPFRTPSWHRLACAALAISGLGQRAHAAPVACSVPEKATEAPASPGKLIVIGFMGGHVHADNFVHREAQVAKALQERYPGALHAAMFANRDSAAALATVLRLIDPRGCPTAAEKQTARIVIYGHSWGASETIAFAKRLNELHIPVLLTVQVDSVQKAHHRDALIPPNVKEAINFYQTEGLLHGVASIQAEDPSRTTILGNLQSSYRKEPVAVGDFPWFARAFMKPHIEIENDPQVWDKIEALIATKVL